MNKIILTIGIVSSMLTSTEKNYEPRQLVWAIDNLQDLKGYIIQDMEEGRISEEYAENYYELLDETEGFIQDYNKKYKTNTIANR